MKLVNVVREDKIPFRVLKEEAESLVKSGMFKYTSKSATKAFFKRYAQSIANEQFLKQFDLSTKQKNNFVSEENGKVVAYIKMNDKPFTYELPKNPKDEAQAQKHKTWIESVVESACINPNDQSIKAGMLSKIAIFFGFLKDFMNKKKELQTHQTIHLPQYHRRVLGYGTIKDHRYA